MICLLSQPSFLLLLFKTSVFFSECYIVCYSRDAETFLYNYYITQTILNVKKQKDCERVEEKGKFISQKVDGEQKYFVVSGLGL